MRQTAPSIEEIFFAALELDSPAARLAFLDRVCGDSDDRRRVEQLLLHDALANDFLEMPALQPAATAAHDPRSSVEEPVGVIGSYILLELIGEGGMGTVWMAQQTEPVKRLVAVKLIKAGMDSRQVIARFEAERQALALMDHPNIARVLDGGTTSAGRPYFVMDLVKGVPITRYCDEHHLTPRQRLELFIPVCQAVQHAHQKGIIHRDLKPSNVLVALYDGKPVPKIIDFGVAKATGQSLTQKTLVTGFGALVGTPEYMSPEQAEINQLDIDTRSDIYSLGVLLYELLTGSLPFTRKELEKAGMLEMLRVIREEEPPKPSTRISELNRPRAPREDSVPRSVTTSLEWIAAQRQTEPAKLTRLLRRELDWIVMKALEKNRDRRYQTASGLAMDLERYLRDEPVLACPPSPWYKVRKLAWRNKGAFAAASAVALLLVLTMITLAASNAWIRREQALTSQEKVRAEKAQALAESRANEVRQGLERLIAANALLERGHWFDFQHNWGDALEAFSQAIQLRPDHVSVLKARADLYTHLGLWDLAAADYAREMEAHQPDLTIRWYQHALLRRAVGDVEGCRQSARAMRERFAGTLDATFFEETLRGSLLVPDPAADLSPLIRMARVALRDRVISLPFVLGTAHYRAGQYEHVVRRLQEWVPQTRWPVGLLGYPVLAMAHHHLGHVTEARRALDETARTLDRWTQERCAGGREVGPRPARGDAAWPVAWWDYLECQLLYAEAKQLIDGTPPPDDPRLHVLRARAFAGLDQRDQADSEFNAALRLRPEDAGIRLEAHRNRGMLCVHHRLWRDAAVEFAKAAELDPNNATLWRFRAIAHFLDGDADAYRQTCTAMLERFGRTEERFAAGDVLLACVLRDGALPDVERLLPLARVSDGLWHWGAEVRGAALYRCGRYEECVRTFETAATEYRPRAWDWCFLAMARHQLRDDVEARRCLSEAKRWIDAANQHTEGDPSGTQPVWGGWYQSAVYPLLLREAEELINGKS
jgi:serine/threonine protein kinase/Tfp pilus assembly protein PilF